jgi:hypothetical protein
MVNGWFLIGCKIFSDRLSAHAPRKVAITAALSENILERHALVEAVWSLRPVFLDHPSLESQRTCILLTKPNPLADYESKTMMASECRL